MGSVFKYASIELQNDREIVLQAVKTSKSFYQEISIKLQNDREIYLVYHSMCNIQKEGISVRKDGIYQKPVLKAIEEFNFLLRKV